MANSSGWFALGGALGGAALTGALTLAMHCSDQRQALTLKRYEVAHIEASHAYANLFGALERARTSGEKWREISVGPGRAEGYKTPEARAIFESSMSDVMRAAAALDPYLDPNWQGWLKAAVMSQAGALLKEGRPVHEEEIRRHLWGRLFGRDQLPGQPPPTPEVGEYRPTPPPS